MSKKFYRKRPMKALVIVFAARAAALALKAAEARRDPGK
jgi:hypothetical protein